MDNHAHALAKATAGAVTDLSEALQERISEAEITSLADVKNFLIAWTAGANAVADRLRPSTSGQATALPVQDDRTTTAFRSTPNPY